MLDNIFMQCFLNMGCQWADSRLNSCKLCHNKKGLNGQTEYWLWHCAWTDSNELVSCYITKLLNKKHHMPHLLTRFCRSVTKCKIIVAFYSLYCNSLFFIFFTHKLSIVIMYVIYFTVLLWRFAYTFKWLNIFT